MSVGSGREGKEGTGASQAPQALGALALVRRSLTAHLAEGAGVWLPTWQPLPQRGTGTGMDSGTAAPDLSHGWCRVRVRLVNR